MNISYCSEIIQVYESLEYDEICYSDDVLDEQERMLGEMEGLFQYAPDLYGVDKLGLLTTLGNEKRTIKRQRKELKSEN